MNYKHTVLGRFIERPNRFIAHVMVNGQQVICHVKNTGRCRELLVPGCLVILEFHPDAKKLGRKTEFDLIAVYKGSRLINMDSQAPNQAAWEWIKRLADTELSDASDTDINALMALQPFSPLKGLYRPGAIRREQVHGDSRFDLSFTLEHRETGDVKQAFMEIKGVTLEETGIVRFPDAPTQRGVKHLLGLTDAISQGYEAFVLFVIQMEDVKEFRPNDETHRAFGDALRAGAEAGLHILAYDCRVTEDSINLHRPVTVRLS